MMTPPTMTMMVAGIVPARRANMLFQYETDMRVQSRSDPSRKGLITEVESRTEVRVLWDGKEGSSWCEAEGIIPDSPEARQLLAETTKQIQAKVDEATNLLEQAFKAWFEAAGLQAGREVDNGEAYYLRGNTDLDLSKFEGVVESNGWSTSSLYC